jgi:hypothetical protein
VAAAQPEVRDAADPDPGDPDVVAAVTTPRLSTARPAGAVLTAARPGPPEGWHHAEASAGYSRYSSALAARPVIHVKMPPKSRVLSIR